MDSKSSKGGKRNLLHAVAKITQTKQESGTKTQAQPTNALHKSTHSILTKPCKYGQPVHYQVRIMYVSSRSGFRGPGSSPERPTAPNAARKSRFRKWGSDSMWGCTKPRTIKNKRSRPDHGSTKPVLIIRTRPALARHPEVSIHVLGQY